jgi:D-serine deaminase-like pyridoxal phosphate-dependent protein
MIHQIISPTLFLDKEKCLNNIRQMVDKARRHKKVFRPHFKTHRSAEVGSWFREFGVEKITVSSVSMAEHFANNGWRDILIAFPVNVREIEKIKQLAAKIKLYILIESVEVLDFLKKNPLPPCGFYLKIDCGYGRTGIAASDFLTIDEILLKAKSVPGFNFVGFLTHSGNTYTARSKDEIADLHYESIRFLQEIKKKFVLEYPDLLLSIGDTPSCSLMDNFEGIDEIRPGNFVFYDLMQAQLGTCQYADIALALACPVVAKHPARKEIVIYGGGIHLSKDFLLNENGLPYFGLVSTFDARGQWSNPLKNTYISRLSQEHGTVKCDPEIFDSINIGDLLAVLPIHSCLTASAMQNRFRIV